MLISQGLGIGATQTRKCSKKPVFWPFNTPCGWQYILIELKLGMEACTI